MTKRTMNIVSFLAVAAIVLLPSLLIAGSDSPFSPPMKLINEKMKFIKKTLAANSVTGVKEAAEAISAEVVKVKGMTPKKNEPRKAELGPLADQTAQAAKDLATATDVTGATKKFTALGGSCEKCHHIFQDD